MVNVGMKNSGAPANESPIEEPTHGSTGAAEDVTVAEVRADDVDDFVNIDDTEVIDDGVGTGDVHRADVASVDMSEACRLNTDSISSLPSCQYACV